jgi:UDP-GlcNAc:undecaprenyl-phosphate GlcNAc-1-phosphate transferase
LVDDPKRKKHPKVIHKKPIPRGGGLIVYISILIASMIFLPLEKHLLAILLGATFVILIGLLDDKYNINPYLRLVMQVFAAAIPISAGIGVSFITNPFNGIIDLSHPQIGVFLLGQERHIWLFSDLFALFWIVFLMNILNMGAKGVDGQLTGVVVVASLTITVLSFKFSADITEWPVTILASIVAGAYLGFLPWHIFPQKIMPSFAGSNLAGYMLAVLSILSTTKVGTLMVVLGVPLIDTGYVIVRRIASGKSPVWGDAGHLHHRLLRGGLNKMQVAYFYWAVSAILGILALSLNASNKLYTIIGVAVGVGGLILWLTYRPRSLE